MRWEMKFGTLGTNGLISTSLVVTDVFFYVVCRFFALLGFSLGYKPTSSLSFHFVNLITLD